MKTPTPPPNTLEAKRAAAKKVLGSKWLLHPSNRVQRKTPVNSKGIT